MENHRELDQAWEEVVNEARRREQDAKEGKGRERPVKEPPGLGKRVRFGLIGLVFLLRPQTPASKFLVVCR